jgi:hypothetical protein
MRDFSENHAYRQKHPTLGWGDHEGGFFYIPSKKLRIIASTGAGWDHVSVSREDRCPTWDEMNLVKELFFKEDETAIQIHPPASSYKNFMRYCLHLWRPQQAIVPLPPTWMVAP